MAADAKLQVLLSHDEVESLWHAMNAYYEKAKAEPMLTDASALVFVQKAAVPKTLLQSTVEYTHSSLHGSISASSS